MFRFFDSGSVKDILETILPTLNLFDLPTFTNQLALLVTFLPAHSIPPAVVELRGAQIYWIPMMFDLWSRVVNCPNVDMLFLDIFSKLAKNHHHQPQSLGWSDKQISIIYAIGARSLGLPVGSGTSGLETAPLPTNRHKGLSEFGVMDYPVSIHNAFVTVFGEMN